VNGRGAEPAGSEPVAGRVARDDGATGTQHLVPHDGASQLALETRRLGPGEEVVLVHAEHDTLLFAFEGGGSLTAGDRHELAVGTAAYAAPGQTVELLAGPDGLAAVCAMVGPEVDLHAPLGPRADTVGLDHVEPGQATGSRSFQVLYGPHNGSMRATLFAGYIPPGRAPWHHHLYDEIVWVLRGTGRLHLERSVEDLSPGCSFRLRPREVHIVENTQEHDELVVLGLFTPAGSPSAAYVSADVAAAYAIRAQ
jgi:quercetin dioxygenase-like cupin family protein